MDAKRSSFWTEAAVHAQPQPAQRQAADDEEESCAAFGYLRGVRDRSPMIEFRMRSGDSEFLSYSCLVSVRYNPSAGILLRFAADRVTLVMIQGSNLGLVLPDRQINLTDRGLQRHRITFVREMDERELRRVGKTEPTIDKIEIGEFSEEESMQKWLEARAASFIRK